MNISLDSNSLLNVSKKMVLCTEDLTSNINHLIEVINSINNAWHGHDALKYINIMRDKYVVGLLELKNIVFEYATFLEGIVDAYNVLDETFATKSIEV